MKRIIRFILNKVPRSVIQRVASWLVPLVGVFYCGGKVECPVCGRRYRKFLPYGYSVSRGNALCPHCLSLERHRLMYLYLKRETDFFTARPRLLHIAPEVCLMRHFEKLFKGDFAENYITADLESPLAKVKMDIRNIPFGENEFDVIFCNHLLEHVWEDVAAMKEMYRVMRKGGWGIMMHPVNSERTVTWEDPTIDTPEKRYAAFGQYDHVREYGKDFADRLCSAGFTVEENDYITHFSPAEISKYALRSEIIYLVRKD
jgi:SAM-dependent methyltransferase